jgi:hypothetical protein
MPGTGRHRGRGNAGDGPSRFASGAMTTPLRLNRYDTEPGSAIEPPLRVMATRTSEAARLRLSVRHSMSTATPLGP